MHSRCSWGVAAVAATAAAISACALDPASPEPAGPDPTVGSVTQAFTGGPCPEFGCGANSPVVDTRFDFHDLNLGGNSRAAEALPGGARLATAIPNAAGLMTTIPNSIGLAIVAAGPAQRAQIVKGRSYDLSVIDGRFIGTCTGCGTLQGSALVGATITLTMQTKTGPVPRYVITIASVREMSYFRGSGKTAAYTLQWRDINGGPTTNLCNNIKLLEDLIAQQHGDEGYAAQELMGLQTYETVIFEGDRIYSDTMRTDKTGNDSWFNIGCAGHTLAKLRLTQNTIHSQTPAWESRQATLKLLTADYCDAGIPLTVAGQRLVWQGDLMGYYSAPLEIEARWTEAGATCLYAPRLLYPTSSLGASTFPDIWSSVDVACKTVLKTRPVLCTNLDPFDYDRTLRVSANPKI